jgi:hypothetical protein
LFLGLFHLGAGGIFEIFEVFLSIGWQRLWGLNRGAATALQEHFLSKPLFKSLTAPPEGLMDCLRRRGQPALQDSEGKAHSPFATFILQGISAVEFLTYVIGHFLVEPRLKV